MARVLVTGGAGFVGSQLAIELAARHPDWQVVALDNLRRRGSELNLERLHDAGVAFVHGDVRAAADLDRLEPLDALIECSAEPSALAGVHESPDYVVQTNLLGAYHCLELARRHAAHVVFVSTSRVYPVALLSAIRYEEADTRFELLDGQELPGVSRAGVSEAFPLEGARTLYGATKLAAELLIAEYRSTYGVSAVVDRCGVIAGPWQMGKLEQGVFAYWMLGHYFRRPLRYLGFGGSGKQVRDLLHVEDLAALVADQVERPGHWDGLTANVGGGPSCSLSLLETTALCEELTGNRLAIEPSGEERPGDVPIYVSDSGLLSTRTDWRPRCGAHEILESIFHWIHENERVARAL